jgi:hypothetical protein
MLIAWLPLGSSMYRDQQSEEEKRKSDGFSMKPLKKSDLPKTVRTSLGKPIADISNHYAIHEFRPF